MTDAALPPDDDAAEAPGSPAPDEAAPDEAASDEAASDEAASDEAATDDVPAEEAPPLFTRPVPSPDAPATPSDTGVQTLTAPDGAVLRLVPVTSEPLWSLARSIRQRVFVEEQGCPSEEEWDVYDEWEAPGAARHVVLFAAGSPAGTARWRVVRGPDGAEAAKLERFAILPQHRGKGLGRVLVGAVVAMAGAAGQRTLKLSAQHHLEGFYRSFGFVRSGDDFREAGILHVPMERCDA